MPERGCFGLKKVDIRNFRKEAVYLEIGNLRSIPISGILGIFDMDSATVSAVTRDMLKEKQKTGEITTASTSLPKSFILYDDGELEQIFFSPFSSVILRQRLQNRVSYPTSDVIESE